MKNFKTWMLVSRVIAILFFFVVSTFAVESWAGGPWHIYSPELANSFASMGTYEDLRQYALDNGWSYIEFVGCQGGRWECPNGSPMNKYVPDVDPTCGGGFQAMLVYGYDEDCSPPAMYNTSRGSFMEYHGTDSDEDGILDFKDNCINTPNTGQADFNRDGEGDACDDEKPDISGIDLGPPGSSCDMQFRGNPVNIFNGNNVETAVDISLGSPFNGGFTLKRYYNSRNNVRSTLGYGWEHNFSYAVQQDPYGDEDQIKVVSGTGKVYYFEDVRPYYEKFEEGPGIFSGKYGEHSSISKDANGDYLWLREDGSSYLFEALTGHLVSITDNGGNCQTLSYDAQDRLDAVSDQASGRTFTFHYNADNLISNITGPITAAVPDGLWVAYTYDTNDNLIRVEYADDGNGSSASGYDYRYEDTNDTHNLTAKYDLASHFISSWTYDTEDRAFENINREGKGVTIDYTDPTAITVTDAYGITSTYTIISIDRRKKITTTDKANGCSSCANGIHQTDYDPVTGDPTRREYFSGRVVQYLDYDANHNPQTVIIDPGTGDEETIAKTYHPVLNTPLTITKKSLLADAENPDRQKITIYDYDDPADPSDTDTPNEAPTNRVHRTILQGYTHDSAGAVVAFEEITVYEYNAHGQITGVDGPLPGSDDAVTLEYDPVTGDLRFITSPLVGTTSFEYDAAGNLIHAVDVNGVETVLAYDGRNRLTTTTIDGKTATLTYTAAGEIDTATDRSGITLDYAYNLQGFLERITHPSGDYLAYLYDTNGNLTEESAHRADDTRTRYQGYDYGDPLVTQDLAPGKPWKLLSRNPEDSADLETVLAYTNGLVSRITDPEGHWKALSYDTRGRLTHTEADQDSTNTALTQYGHDLGDNLTSVTDPEGVQTVYTFDDANRPVKQVSPDAGTTRFTYDSAGRLATKTLADSSTITYTYDLLSRLTDIVYTDSSRNVSFTYDQGAYSKGRLTGISDPSGTYTYTYNSLGQLVSEAKTIAGSPYTTSYTWDDADKLLTITYPWGRIIRYERRADGSMQRVVTEMGQSTTTLADVITHLPFGPLEALTFGNGVTLSKGFDLSYQPAAIGQSGLMDATYIPDDNGNVAQIMDVLALADELFTYDGLYQLTGASGSYNPIDYTYDGVGNRETRTQDQTTQTYTYTEGTNRIEYITGAMAGAGSGIRTYEYNAEGRIKRIIENDVELATYEYNSKGQRTAKTIDGTTTLYHYDLDGLLIAETASSGAVQREYVYLDRQPLAMIDYSSGTAIYFYHNDHLGTPKAMTNIAGTVVWKAWHTPFGEATITVDTVENNLRFAGQYYDVESGLHYNYFRYYDPATGRYLTPDPIGLAGGINPYSYAFQNPITLIDPYGLLSQSERQAIIRNWTAAGASIGAILGYLGGGGAGLLTGPGAPAAVPAGAYAGAAGGTIAGSATGAAIGSLVANLMEGSNDGSDSCEGSDDGSYNARDDKSKTLQRGGRTIKKRTADAFGRPSREVGRALESLKEYNQLKPDFHQTIIKESGNVFNSNTGAYIDNILNYLL